MYTQNYTVTGLADSPRPIKRKFIVQVQVQGKSIRQFIRKNALGAKGFMNGISASRPAPELVTHELKIFMEFLAIRYIYIDLTIRENPYREWREASTCT